MSSNYSPTLETLTNQIDSLLIEEPVRIATVSSKTKAYHRWQSRQTVLGDRVTVAYSEHRSADGQTVYDHMHGVLHEYMSSDGDVMVAQYDLTKGRVLHVRTHPGNEHLSVTSPGEGRTQRYLDSAYDLGRIALLIDAFQSDNAKIV